ncbi:MAG: DUF922 domain-containing protein [Brucellaceae bacterium]|nr:DUF922 domain-containing protein [Brucellaceae bacterium]
MKLRLAPVLFVLALAGCTSTQPAVTTAYYDVKGTTALHLDREIRQLGPNDGHAIAAAEIRFVPVSLRKAQDGRGCHVSEARIKVVANVTLPRWRNRSGSTEELKDAFDSMARYARLHEAVHVEIANAAAREMESELLALPPQKSCETLEKRADAVVREVRKRHDRAQKAFDAAEQRRLKKLFDQAGS